MNTTAKLAVQIHLMYNDCLFCFVVFQLPQAQKVKYFNEILVIQSSHQSFMFPWWCECGAVGISEIAYCNGGSAAEQQEGELTSRPAEVLAESSSSSIWASLTWEAYSSLQLLNTGRLFYQQFEILVKIKKKKSHLSMWTTSGPFCPSCRDCRAHGIAGILSLLPTASIDTSLGTSNIWLLQQVAYSFHIICSYL